MAVVFSDRMVVPDHVLTQELSGELVLLDLKSQHYFGLDPVGTRMWNALADSASIAAAYEALLAEYEVEAQRLRQDMEGFIARLLEQGLIGIAHH